ncbi:MAG: FimB/Mfa2 family fimbrial subunit [Prevotella sp.]|jgi:hypothetical protein|nr:FimB/Mfa2 family fimbrial subunit [Prevotella sp.]
MKLVVLYGLIISVFLSFGSCKNTDDGFLPDDVLPPVPEGYVRMQITVPGLTPVSTYALSSVDETHVSEVDVLVFGSDSKYLCHAAVTEPSKITDTGSTKTFDVDLRAAGNITSTYVMVVANAHADVSAAVASFTPSTTKETAMQSMTFVSSGKWNATGSSNFKPFPMWGMTATPVSLAGTSSISSISLIRSVARIDVGINFPDGQVDGTENAAGLGSTFTLEEVYLYNSLDKGSVAPYSGYYSGTTVTVPSIPDSPSAPGINDSPVPSYLSSNGAADGFNANKFSCTGAIYMAEHAAGTDALTNNPYLVIGGRYGGSTADITYYRLDFVSDSYPNQEFLDVLRNHRYRFNITGVAGPGYGSITAAADARPVNFTYDLSATDESLTSYDDNGQYALGVSQDSYTFDRDGKSGNSLKISATFGKYSVVINPVAPTNNIDWLTDVTGAGDNVAAFGELTFNVSANDSGGERSAEIVITSGLLTKEITVRQTNKAGFEVQTVSGSPTYTSGLGSLKYLTVESSYDWCVNVEDPNGIITRFDAKGTSSTTSFSFIPKASSYYSITEATFTFFSPTGEFGEVTRTVSVPGATGDYLPSSHNGWAGSNIYWDPTLRSGNGALTFADMTDSQLATKEHYQGVFFKWGSLVGLDPSQSYTITASDKKTATDSWTSDCRVYVPVWVPGAPHTSYWTGSKADSSTPVYSSWGSIPWAGDNIPNNKNDNALAYLTMDAGAAATTNTTNGGHVPFPNKTVPPAGMKGDICRYLTQTGDAPGSPTVKWRMPTAAEFAVPSGITNDNDYVSTADGWSGNNAQATSPYGMIAILGGRRKNYSHVSPTTQLPVAQRPFFPAAGRRGRSSTDGDMYYVDHEGVYWTASPCSGSNASLLFFYKSTMGPISSGDPRQWGFPVRCVKE